jgi:hypothetical protein
VGEDDRAPAARVDVASHAVAVSLDLRPNHVRLNPSPSNSHVVSQTSNSKLQRQAPYSGSAGTKHCTADVMFVRIQGAAAHCMGEAQVHVTGNGGAGAIPGFRAGGAGCGIHNVSRPLLHVHARSCSVPCGDSCGTRLLFQFCFNLMGMGSAPAYEQMGGAYAQ